MRDQFCPRLRFELAIPGDQLTSKRFDFIRQQEKYAHCYVKTGLDSLPNDNNLDVTKLKAFADDKINVAQMMISVFDRVEKIVRKGENAGYQHFLLFSQCFERLLSWGSLEVDIEWMQFR